MGLGPQRKPQLGSWGVGTSRAASDWREEGRFWGKKGKNFSRFAAFRGFCLGKGGEHTLRNRGGEVLPHAQSRERWGGGLEHIPCYQRGMIRRRTELAREFYPRRGLLPDGFRGKGGEGTAVRSVGKFPQNWGEGGGVDNRSLLEEEHIFTLKRR